MGEQVDGDVPGASQNSQGSRNPIATLSPVCKNAGKVLTSARNSNPPCPPRALRGVALGLKSYNDVVAVVAVAVEDLEHLNLGHRQLDVIELPGGVRGVGPKAVRCRSP